MKHIFIFVVISGIVFFSMCKKPESGKVTVTVVVEDTTQGDVVIPGATVILYTKPNGSYVDTDSLIPEVTKVTNAQGIVEFYKDYDCILNIKATYTNSNNVKYTGSGIGIFKVDQVYETKIELK